MLQTHSRVIIVEWACYRTKPKEYLTFVKQHNGLRKTGRKPYKHESVSVSDVSRRHKWFLFINRAGIGIVPLLSQRGLIRLRATLSSQSKLVDRRIPVVIASVIERAAIMVSKFFIAVHYIK